METAITKILPKTMMITGTGILVFVHLVHLATAQQSNAAALANAAFSQICTVNSPTGGLIYRINETAHGSKLPNLVLDLTQDVFGSPQHIRLDFLENPGNFFSVEGKRLRLIQELDRERLKSDTLLLRLRCTFSVSSGGTFGQAQSFQREIPITVLVDDLNDNSPVFQNTPYRLELSEDTPVGQTVFRGIQATDSDVSRQFAALEYQIVPGGGSPPGSDAFFKLNSENQAHVVLTKPLSTQKFTQARILITALDNIGHPLANRRSTVTTLDVKVVPSLTKNTAPAFIHPDCQEGGQNRIPCENVEYRAMIRAGESPPQNNVLTVVPSSIQAINPNSVGTTVTYHIVSGVPQDFSLYFDLDSKSGALIQKQAIPFGYADIVELSVQARPQGGQGKPANAKVLIDVDSKANNVHDPVLTATSLQGFILENAPIGSTVRTQPQEDAKPLQVLVTDLDLQPGMAPATYQYVLTNSGAGIFAINQGGYVYLNTPHLDSDSPGKAQYDLTIEAREVGTSPIRKSEKLTITINLVDLNNNPPKFEQQVHNVRVNPGQAPIAIAKLGASDQHSSRFGTIRYRIASVSNGAESFFYYLSQNETLMAIKPLAPGQQYQVVLEASDSGGQKAQAVILVDVESDGIPGIPIFTSPPPSILPQATLNPLQNFNQGPVLKIPENLQPGTQITQIQADVVGQGPRDLQYFIVSGNENGDFAMDPSTGIISVAKLLNVARQQIYDLQLQAANSLGLSNSTGLRIELQPAERRPPKILNPQPIAFQLTSNQPGTRVGQIISTTGGSGGVHYAINPPHQYVRISPNGTITTTDDLALARNLSQFAFTVSVFSGNLGSEKFTSVPVTVRLLKQQPQPPMVPKFEQEVYLAEISENFPPRPLVVVRATTGTPNRRVTYKMLQGDSSLFSVDPKKGTVSTQGSLDAELATEYMLVIGSEEGKGSQEAEARTKVKVRVLDVNDWTPEFSSLNYRAKLQDTAPIGSPVVTVRATDQDRDSPNNLITYSIAPNSPFGDHFFVHPQNGEVTTAKPLTDIPQPDIIVYIEAKDAGTPLLSTTASVHIRVQPTPGTRPSIAPQLLPSPTLPVFTTTRQQFTPSTTTAKQREPIAFQLMTQDANVSKSVRPPFKVATLKVKNKPAEIGRTVVCTIIDGNMGNRFKSVVTQENDCEIVTIGLLDREQTAKHFLNVSVAMEHDGKWEQNFAQLIVSIIGSNDNGPTFQYPAHYMALINPPAYFGAIDEKAPPQTRGWLRINATSTGSNPRITYTLENHVHDVKYFAIDPYTGELSNAVSLKNVYRKVQGRPPYFELQATATDSSTGSSRTATTSVIVNVIRPENRLFVKATVPRIQRADYSNPKLLSDEDFVKLAQVLQSRTPFCKVFGLEKFQENQNGTGSPDSTAIDITLYAVNPRTKLLCTEENLAHLTQPNFLPQVQQHMSTTSLRPTRIQTLRQTSNLNEVGGNRTALAGFEAGSWWTPTNIGLIAAACFVALASFLAILCLCCCWARSKSRVKRAVYMNGGAAFAPTLPLTTDRVGQGKGRRNSSYYDKEYETQMLEMAMAEDAPGKDGLDVGFTVQDGVYSIRAAQPYPPYNHHGALY